MKDYYKLLDIEKDASAQEIKKAIQNKTRRCLQEQNHAQQNRRQQAEREMKDLEKAKTILLDPEQRQKYDRDLALQPSETHQVSDNNLSQDVDELIEEAQRLIALGQIPDAIVIGQRATVIAPTNADAWSVTARAKFLWGDTRDADYEFKKAISLRPNHALFYYDYGVILESSADSQKYKEVANSPDEALMKALDQYQRAYSIDPQTIYLAAQGGVYINTPQYKKGIDILERCVSTEPDEDEYKRILAMAYLQQACYRNWTYINKEGFDEGYYATEIAHIHEAQLYVAKAQKLKIVDDTVTGAFKEAEDLISRNLQRQFLGNWTLAIVGGIIYLAFGGIGFFLVPLYYFACRVPQYSLNNKIFNGKGNNIVYLFAGNSNDLRAILVWIVILGLFFPVIIIANFLINYWDVITNRNPIEMPELSNEPKF